ncbi:hypothetical protein ACFPLB_10220 [Aquamicrobium segne]|uniref:Autotransporter domain-containing protein n=1 Tax=Aquamicrobium segne TaxID=469547 RepID=A0ABW0GZN6_9HYPH
MIWRRNTFLFGGTWATHQENTDDAGKTVAPGMTVRANYDGLFSSDQFSHSGSIDLNIRF